MLHQRSVASERETAKIIKITSSRHILRDCSFPSILTGDWIQDALKTPKSKDAEVTCKRAQCEYMACMDPSVYLDGL